MSPGTAAGASPVASYRLTGLVGELKGRELILSSTKAVVGRDPSQCDLVLEHALISRRHALLEVDAEGHVDVTDLGSRQGTFVNGERVASRRLNDQDVVGFGREGLVTFRFNRFD